MSRTAMLEFTEGELILKCNAVRRQTLLSVGFVLLRYIH